MRPESDPRPPSSDPTAATREDDAVDVERGRGPSAEPAAPSSGQGDEAGDDRTVPSRESAPVPGRSGGPSASPGRRRPFGPRALRKPGRTETRMKDMLGALLILIPIALLIVGVGQSCSFSPLGPTVDAGAGPRVDAAARLAEYARTSRFPIRVPDVPWRSNATDRGEVEGGTAVRVGYLTEQGRYLRLVQTDASEESVLRTETGGGAVTADGVTPAAGSTWVTYRNTNGEPVRIATLSGVRLLVTGSGTDDEFRTLADAVARARVLPPGAAGR